MLAVTDDITEAVRVELARRNWSRAKLAEETGVSRQMMSEMLNNKRGRLSPSWEKVFEVLGWTVHVFDSKGNRIN